MKLQPLRIEAGWTVSWNMFKETVPNKDNMHEFADNSMLLLENYSANRIIELTWYPEGDING